MAREGFFFYRLREGGDYDAKRTRGMPRSGNLCGHGAAYLLLLSEKP